MLNEGRTTMASTKANASAMTFMEGHMPFQHACAGSKRARLSWASDRHVALAPLFAKPTRVPRA